MAGSRAHSYSHTKVVELNQTITYGNMENAASKPQPPITQLRPLHSLQQPCNQELETSSSDVQRHLEDDSQLLHWSSPLEPRPDEDTSIKAFVKLVSHLVILDPGEAYCVQDAARGGFILAHSPSASCENETTAFSFIGCEDAHDIPTDFSIGKGKALQLHIDAATKQVQLTAQANVIPSAALEALSRMLDDLIISLQHDQSKVGNWTQPSVLNFPPQHRPLSLFPSVPDQSSDLRQKEIEDNGAEPALLHRWFELRAAETPHRVALDYLVDFDDGKRIQYTYQQVENAANALAAKLVSTCAHSTSQRSIKTVAVLMGPCPELYISYLAVLKAGMAFCPIPVDAPAERKEALIADLNPTALLSAASTQSGSVSPSWSSTVTVISVTPYLAACDTKSEGPTVSSSLSITETDVAYILYTSGTTGMPKGVAVSHISAACTVSALSAHYGLVSPTSSDSSELVRWFQGAAPTFDISLFEIFWTLSTGSTLCCAPREFTLQNIDKVVTTLKADMTNITPSFASLLDPSSIRGLMVGGETLNTRLLKDFAHYNPGTGSDSYTHIPSGIYNGYGPTEAAIYCIAQAHVPEDQRGSVLGTPLATCGVLIVDEQTQTATLEPVPMGATGELVITGPQVSSNGYLNRPDETASAFVDDAHWGRAYRTGDRARIVWDRRGEPMVEFLGRISDDQVKLSGRRVELGEIESVLASRVEGVRETLSCVWKQQVSDLGSEKVVSLVVLEPRANLSFEVVRQDCLEAAKQHLPDYMRPFKILLVDSLPKSASGKADRKATAAYVRETLEKDIHLEQSQPTRDEILQDIGSLSDPEDVKLEEEIVSIVSNILNVSSTTTKMEITATTPLAEAGMDSLRAMRLLRDMRKKLSSPKSAVHQHQSAHLQPSLAQLLDSGASIRSVFFPTSQGVDGSAKLDVTRRKLADFSSRHLSDALDKLYLASKDDVEMVLPATCTQSQLAVSFAMDRRNYISHSVLKLNSGVSSKALKEAIEIVVSEQAIYRCAILPCDDSLSPFAQVILTQKAWNQSAKSASRVVHRKASESELAGDSRAWLDLAEENISLDSQSLYHIQVVEPSSSLSLDSGDANLLIISVAHCICDGASLEVLMSDIARRYAGLEPLPRQGIYEAVLEWASNVDPETDELWRESLKGWETESFGALSGNNIKPSAAIAGCGHGMVQYTSDLSWQVLEDKSRTLGASPLSVLQASWSLLLYLFSEADTGDMTFGSVISGHHLSAHAPTFSVVPCRVALPDMQTTSRLLTSLTNHSKFAQSHRHTSFGIFKTLPYNTALALQAYHPPDPKTANGPGEAVPVLWTEIQNPAIRYDFAIFAEVFPTSPHSSELNEKFSNMSFKLTYRDDALSQLSATYIVKQLAALTETMLSSDPDEMVQCLPARLPKSLLSAEGTVPVPDASSERDQQRRDRLELLHSQFEDQVASTPDLLALSFYTSLDLSPVELSYAGLDARANSLANVLREEDVDIIPICMQRSVELYVSILAILKAGSAWCPIDETSPVQRRTSLIARTQSKVLLTTTESLPLVEPCLAHESLEGVRIILVDQYANQKSSERANPRRSISSSNHLGGQDLAYLLWTSGTTGEPKGVMMQHSAAAQAMRDLQIQVEHDENAEQVRTLQLSAYSFDVFVQDLFYTWGLAGSVISGTRELVLGTFVDFIWKSRPTHAHLTPSFGASIAVDEIRGSTLQYVTFIGEKLTEDVAEAWATPGITTRTYNTYGPAENAVVSTLRRFYGKSRDEAKAANVGFPLNHCTSYVVREVEISPGGQKRWELVPRYGVGELALGGAQVAKGYLCNEAKTAKAFIQGGPGIDERIYLTGDTVRLNDHGFEFLGRNDDLVKITGIRIELSEISAACASVKDEEPAVEHVETLYLLRPGAQTDSNNKVIVTFVSVKKDAVDTGKIRAQVFQRAKDMLPTYMVPGHVVVLDTTMPRTASNKVDRKALQEIYKASDLNVLAGRDASKQSTIDGQPRVQWTDEQLPVLQAIADNFKVEIEPLSPEDSLAGLGFSSLEVTKLAWLLRRQLACAVGVLDLMRCQFLGELVDVVVSKFPDQTQSNGSVSPQPPAEKSWLASTKDLLTKELHGDLRPHDTSYLLPATPMQESLIVETMLEPRAYWAHRVFDLSHLGEIDGHRLKEAWTAAAREFDILRTIFVPLTQLDVESTEKHENSVAWARQYGVQSTILQLVRDEPTVCWTWLSSDKDQELARWAEKLQVDLAPATTSQPPWAVTVAERESKMMLSMHHALYDSVSSDILLDTVAKFYYDQARDGQSHDGVVRLERGMELGLLPTASQRSEAATLWNSHLANLRKTAGALNAPFPDLTQSRQKQPEKILLSRKAIPPSFFASSSTSPALPTLLQSAFGCVLASYLELKAVVFGQTVSQRSLHPDLARVMGPAIATLPVVVRADSPSAEELWRNMATDSSSLFRSTHNLHPVDIKRMLNQGSGSTNASFPGLFVYHPAPESSQGTQDNAGQQLFREVEQALSLNVEHPLALNIFEADGAMELTGDGRRISQAQLELMLDQIIEQARVMVESPRLPLDQLQNKMSRNLVSISGETLDGDVHSADPTENVALHATEHPEWIAVEELGFQESDGDEDEIVTKPITYAQLDKLTNAIASRLASHEARLQPDDVVAMYMGRDIKSLAVTLAIFRAGYVYLPVDEDLPPARKRLLVRDAKAKIIITTDGLFGDLESDLESDPPALLIPDGNDDIDVLLSWPISERQLETGYGGYLLYTSGSTGRPKGVRVSNSNLCHFIASFTTRLVESSPITASLGGVGKYLNLTSRAFDPHLTQLFVPWYLGHRVVIGKDRTAMLGSLQQVINKLDITHFGSVPSVLTQLRLRPEDVPSVRVVTTGGEKASSELLDTWTKGCGYTGQEGHKQQQAVLFNFYGPTEVTIGCLGHAVNRNSNARNLGLPLQGLEAVLLCPSTGDEKVIARRGQPGELCIAGPQVVLGYLDRPVENAKSFQTTTLLGVEKRIYRTGDIMRMMHDGTLEFLGRADQQAKIRGQRLELDEVVSFLKEASVDEGDLDFAATVAVSGDDKSSRQQQLLGFVARNARTLLKGETEAEVELLQNHSQALSSLLRRIEQKCETGLPAFMVPTLLWVSRIPYLAASGKVDTKLLSKLADDFIASQQGQGGPVSAESTTPAGSGHALDAKESLVVAAVDEAVGSAVNAKATSTLHRLGVDSLSAVHLVSLLRKRGFSKLTLADILSPSCTVRSIAQLDDRDLDNSVPASSTDRLQENKALSMADLGPLPVGLDSQQIEAVLPCLPLQSALVARSLLWLSASDGRDDGETAVDVPYVAHFHYRLSSGTDISKWKKAAELAVASEAMFRTCFVQREDDGQVFQVVLRSPYFSPFDSEGDSADVVAQMSVRPPIRMKIRETAGSNETIVSLKIHHALFDGVAIDLFRERLQQGYDAQGPIPSPVNSFNVLKSLSSYCHLSSAQTESARRFWQTRLQGVRPCRVGADSDNNKHGAMVRSTLCFSYTTSQLKAKLQTQSQQSGVLVSASSAFQLATALCLAKLTRQTSVVYGFVMSLRTLLGHVSDGVEDFIGPCLNTLVRTLSFQGGNETLPELAQRVHEDHVVVCQGAMPLVSVEMVQRWAGSEDKLFDSLLSINLVPADVATNGEPGPGRMSALRTQSKSDMALAIDVDLHADGKIVLTLSSAGSLTEAQLDDAGRLFEKAVCSCADQDARVEHFVTLHHDTNAVAHTLNGFEPESDAATEGYQEALACVQNTAFRLLRLKPSDISDKTTSTSLYQIGLDSIAILPFVKLINKSENIKLTPNAVIKARTIQGAARLVQEAKTKTDTIVNGNKRRDSKANYDNLNNSISSSEVYDKTLGRLAKDLMFVATPLQEGMLSASLAIAGKAYSYVHTVQLSEYALRADTPSLTNFLAAVNDTVQACEILRTRFIFTQDDEAPWVGVVSPSEQSDLISWEVMKSGLPGRIQLRIHHALYDATSIQAVWRILDDNYRCRLQGQVQNGEEATAHLFRPFARTVALVQKSSVAFWTSLIQDYMYTPLDLPDDSLQASSAFHFALDEQELSLLQTKCRAISVTIKAALQLAWAKVLCESIYGQDDIVYGEVVSTGDGDAVMVGPTINTVPMRVNLMDQGISFNLAEALTQVQKLSDDSRGENAMASLRKIQTLWRASSRDREHVPASLFQSLFVFDGVMTPAETDSDELTRQLFKPVQTQTQSVEGASDGPAYDEYPLIVSFQIKNNTLHGKLRGKMVTGEVERLGSRLRTALRYIVSHELQSPALDISDMKTVARKHLAVHGRDTNRPTDQLQISSLNSTGEAVLELVKMVLSTRCEDKDIGYNTRLVNVGLDSILAIRFSKLLRKKLGINASVFDIVKGASVHDIVNDTISKQSFEVQEPKQPLVTQNEELKELVAKDLGLPKDFVKSVLPVLAGQRAHLEQWLYNGKRFFEAPWVYRVVDDSVDTRKVASCWTELCRIHEALRTTFVWTGSATGLVQVTLGENWTGEGQFTALQDLTKSVQSLINEHVGHGNGKPSDLREPPARLLFLEGLDGKAIVLRIHHALYDAWSIKMIEQDFNELLAVGKVLQTRTPFEHLVHQIKNVRQSDAEDTYWKHHLSHSQETVLQLGAASVASSTSACKSSLGPHFKASYPAVVPQSTIEALSRTKNNARTSAAIILAYARTLGHFTERSQPTFGHNHASRSLCSADGAQTLDLTGANVPTLTVTPFCVDLDSQSPGTSSDEHLLDFVQDHLAQLTKFAQSDGVQKFCPRFNSYINILFPGDNDAEHVQTTTKVLSRHRLEEPLASDYFTIAEPSSSTVCTIEGLETSHLCPHRFFFNVIVHQGQDVSVAVSGDDALCGGDLAMVTKLVSYFGSELAKVMTGASTS
ncbi:Nonribosomal peptide synthetase 2 [Neonectria ditissima]|uniref:Nonribosomal peptide synthetase 2 n=1 Tax=Neonectria ditissima TaxID=78410 RepID=A0A0P7BHZ8_9HYPO|nr:Nonribosomal peptide synthetase 2 [Neonectria ditissima]